MQTILKATTKAKPFSYRVGYLDMSEKYLDQIVDFYHTAVTVARLYHEYLEEGMYLS